MLGLIIIICLLTIVALTLYAYLLGTAPVPTPATVVPAMIAAAEIKPGDKVFDLGCGDGRLVFAAAARGAQATGLEISPLVFAKNCKKIPRQNSFSRYAHRRHSHRPNSFLIYVSLH
jgi:predicted RNA methylase